jgi:hypothetical protein
MICNISITISLIVSNYVFIIIHLIFLELVGFIMKNYVSENIITLQLKL